MKVMVMVKATKDSEAGVMPPQQLLIDMMKYNEELVKAGIMLAGEGLKPTSCAKRVRFSGKDRIVTDGPFTETNEIVAGYWLWNVKSMDEAVEWVKKCPNPMFTDSDVDIRPIISAEDFSEIYTPELHAQEADVNLQAIANAIEHRQEIGPDLTLAGLNGSYTFETRDTIPAQWCKFLPHIGRVPGQKGRTTYGVCWKSNSNHESCDFDYLCAVEVDDAAKQPAEFTTLKIPSRRYVVFTHVGRVAELPTTLEAIWKKWIPNSGLKPAQAPCFERYSENFNPETSLGDVEVWVPIQE